MSRRLTSSFDRRKSQGGPACETPPNVGLDDLMAVIRAYRRHVERRVAREIDHYRDQPTLRRAIREAGMARTCNEKRHPHQYRIPSAALVHATNALLAAPVSRCGSFDELHQLVKTTIGPIRGIGELTVYDTSHRIGAKLGLEPRRVYLHAGTRAGAQALGFSVRRESIELAELPAAFRTLSAAQVEDCLCIYKDALARTAKRR